MNTQTLPTDVINAVQVSPIFAEVTAKFNEYVENCNKTGHKISVEERSKLEEIRILTVLATDETAKKMFADYMWETVNA